MFVSVVRYGWLWWWDGSTIESLFARVVFTMFFALLLISWYTWSIQYLRKMDPSPLPPGPLGLPLVGNLQFLKPDLHRFFAKLTKTYGPIFKLRLGNKLYVVLSSPSLTKEVLTDRDDVFGNRDALVAALSASNSVCVTIDPNGPTFRTIRKLLVHELLTSANLDACYAIHEREVHQTLREVYAKVNTPTNIREHAYLTMIKMTISMLLDGNLESEMRTRIGKELQHLVAEIVELLEKPNVSNIFPALAMFDLQGIDSRYKKAMAQFDQIFDSIVDHKTRKGGGESCPNNKETKSFLDLISDVKIPVTMTQLKNLFVELIVASTDTTSTTLEWATTEIMQNPDIMTKVQAELDEVVGIQNMVQGSHLSSLPYLDAVIKETLRLHPAVPLLSPHCSDLSSIVGGYTRVLFNVWAIHRNPEAWDDPLKFKPERFLSDSLNERDYEGNCFTYLPFGSGRRMCVGNSLAQRMVTFTLASILHMFQLKLPEGTMLDLSDEFGVVLKKRTPLVVIPSPRLLNHKLYDH